VVIPGTVTVLAGYAFGTMKFHGSSLLFYIFLIGLVMPFESTIVPYTTTCARWVSSIRRWE